MGPGMTVAYAFLDFTPGMSERDVLLARMTVLRDRLTLLCCNGDPAGELHCARRGGSVPVSLFASARHAGLHGCSGHDGIEELRS